MLSTETQTNPRIWICARPCNRSLIHCTRPIYAAISRTNTIPWTTISNTFTSILGHCRIYQCYTICIPLATVSKKTGSPSHSCRISRMTLGGNAARWSPPNNSTPSNFIHLFRIYGGLQEFISFSVFENTIRYAFERGILNTKLNRNNWQSRFFQFYAGDLYEVIPEIGNRFLAT